MKLPAKTRTVSATGWSYRLYIFYLLQNDSISSTITLCTHSYMIRAAELTDAVKLRLSTKSCVDSDCRRSGEYALVMGRHRYLPRPR